MVKLIFNPKNKSKSELDLENLKLNENLKVNEKNKKILFQNKSINFNPFLNVHENSNENGNENGNESQNGNVLELKTKDLIGLENFHFILKQWYFNTLQNKETKTLLVIGPTGCGKTTLVNLFCKEEEIKTLSLKVNDNRTKKELLKEIELFIDYSTENFFLKNVKIKKLILIDEYQNASNDIISITDILALREKGIPILIISADSKGSKLSDIKKTCEVYYINEIPPNSIKKWILSLTKYTLTPVQIGSILQKCKSDKRLILNLLDFTQGSDVSVIDSYLEMYQKDVDINLFDFTKCLFDDIEPPDINDIFKIYDNDGFILSNLIHENYLDYNQDIDKIANAADAISYGEILFSDTYESNKTFIPDAHCINSIVLPSFYARSSLNSRSLVRSSVINNRFNILLNNKKIISKINVSTFKMYIYDIYLIKNVLNQELIKSKTPQTNKINFIKNILKSLDNNIEKLELIYKHFSDFKEHVKEVKTKSFTIKFKEKLKEN